MISQEQTHLLKTVFLDNGREVLDSKNKSALLYNLHVLADGDEDGDDNKEDQKIVVGNNNLKKIEEKEDKLAFFSAQAKRKEVPDKIQFEIGSSKGSKKRFLDNAMRLCVHEGIVPSSVVLSEKQKLLNQKKAAIRIKMLKQKQQEQQQRRRHSSSAITDKSMNNIIMMNSQDENNTNNSNIEEEINNDTNNNNTENKPIPLHVLFPSARQQQAEREYQQRVAGRTRSLSLSGMTSNNLNAKNASHLNNRHHHQQSSSAIARTAKHEFIETVMGDSRMKTRPIALTCPHCSLSEEVPPVMQVRSVTDSKFPRAQYKLSMTAMNEDELDERLWTVLTNLFQEQPEEDHRDNVGGPTNGNTTNTKKRKNNNKKPSSITKKKQTMREENKDKEGESNSLEDHQNNTTTTEDNCDNDKNNKNDDNNNDNNHLLSDPDKIAEHFEFRVGAPPWHEYWTRLDRFSEELRERKVANNEAAKVRLASLEHELAVVTAQVRALSQGLLEVDPVHKLRTLETEEKRAEYECNNYYEAIRLIEEQLRYLAELEARSLMHTGIAIEESRRATATLNDLSHYISRSAALTNNSSDLADSVDLEGLAQLIGDVLATAPIAAKDEEQEAEVIGRRKNPTNVFTQRFQCPDCMLLCQFSKFCPATGKRHPEMTIPGREDEEEFNDTFGDMHVEAFLADAGLSASVATGSPIAKMLLMAARLDHQQQKEEQLEIEASGSFNPAEEEEEHLQQDNNNHTSKRKLTKKGSARSLWLKFKEREEEKENGNSPTSNSKQKETEKLESTTLSRDNSSSNFAHGVNSDEDDEDLPENHPSLKRLNSYRKAFIDNNFKKKVGGGDNNNNNTNKKRRTSENSNTSSHQDEPEQQPDFKGGKVVKGAWRRYSTDETNNVPPENNGKKKQKTVTAGINNMHSLDSNDNSLDLNQVSGGLDDHHAGTLTQRRRTVHFANSGRTEEDNDNNDDDQQQQQEKEKEKESQDEEQASPSPSNPNNNSNNNKKDDSTAPTSPSSAFAFSAMAFSTLNTSTTLSGSTISPALSRSQNNNNKLNESSSSPMNESITAGLGMTRRLSSNSRSKEGFFSARNNSLTNVLEELPDHCIGDDKTAEKIIEEHVSEILQCAVRRDLEGMRWHHRRFSKLLIPEKEGGPNRHIPKSYFEVLLELERMFVEWFAAMVNRQKDDAKLASIGASRIGASSSPGGSAAGGAQAGTGSPTTTSALKRHLMEDRVRKLQREARDLKYSIAKRPKGRQAHDVDDDEVFEALALRVKNLQRKKGAMRSRLRGSNDENRAIETRINLLKGELWSPSAAVSSANLTSLASVSATRTSYSNSIHYANNSASDDKFLLSNVDVMKSPDASYTDAATLNQHQQNNNNNNRVSTPQTETYSFPVSNLVLDSGAQRQTILNNRSVVTPPSSSPPSTGDSSAKPRTPQRANTNRMNSSVTGLSMSTTSGFNSSSTSPRTLRAGGGFKMSARR